jgi:hypothetical protein
MSQIRFYNDVSKVYNSLIRGLANEKNVLNWINKWIKVIKKDNVKSIYNDLYIKFVYKICKFDLFFIFITIIKRRYN